MERLKALFQNPAFNVAMPFMEPFPIGLGVTLISAAILRRPRQERATRHASAAPLASPRP
jgi:hypothetical protein